MASNSTLPAGFVEGSWWYYAPNKVAPIVFAVLFCITGCWHLWQNWHFKSWKSSGLFPIAGFVFVIGYSMREVAAFYYTEIGFYMASNIILLCSPPVFETANLFILGRLLYYVPYHAPLHPWRFMLTFAVFQSFTESINGNGAAKATTPYSGPGEQRIGHILMQTSLMMQIFSALCFILIALRFEYNCRRAGIWPDKLRNSLRMVYLSCALIHVRTIYRTIEWFEPGDHNPNDPSSFPPVLRTEAFFWVFEASVMLTNSFLLNIFHPTRLLPTNYKVYLAPDGVTEIEGRGLGKDPRVWWMQLIDPFDVYGLFTNRDQKHNIWAQEEPNNAITKGNLTTTTSRTDSSSDSASEKKIDVGSWGNWRVQNELIRQVA
ncbi:hypothetical protein DACRYDRAFT_110510 [Dacryopinax primogenitus]|uniref:RTA1 domain protein n=1 Tax=Dacryopinax primogenitus (strain DJM 731) TaxID=1858805 RepID=M5FT91_DACPD|nr:uncharacterized protein DACRYDRAFT_110510 [Dacryopinax primogenitus]EJT98599.1 hypothetical protein DACRYDRAFT_110510 [Dacryopinax primogenitus]